MAEQQQITVKPLAPSGATYGSRNEANLQSCYPVSPLYGGTGGPGSNGPILTELERRKFFQGAVLDGTVIGGHGFNSFNRDYTGADPDKFPDLATVETGGGGLPASPYGPNLTSPGPGSISAAEQPEFNGTLPDVTSLEFGSGLPGTTSPSETSSKIANQSLGNYMKGESFPSA